MKILILYFGSFISVLGSKSTNVIGVYKPETYVIVCEFKPGTPQGFDCVTTHYDDGSDCQIFDVPFDGPGLTFSRCDDE
jgi:hypothetical protein